MLSLLLLWMGLVPNVGLAFQNVKPGDVLPDEQLSRLSGGKESYLGKAKVGVFVFFDVGQQHSDDSLAALAKVEKELSGKPVHWAAIVSDRRSADEVKATVKAAGIQMPVLMDAGDALYSKLGTALTPVVGIVDAEHKLVAYVPFTKVNMSNIVRAWTRRALGEISEGELQEVLNPPAATQGGEQQVALRNLRMGQRLLKAQDLDGALKSAQRSLSHNSTLVPAHVLLGQVLTAQGKCDEAVKAFDAALALDATDAQAAEGKKGCSVGSDSKAAPDAGSAK